MSTTPRPADPVTAARERLERLLPDVLRYDPVSMPAFDQRIDALIEAVRAEAGVSAAVEALADVRARRSTFATAEAFDSAMLEAAWNILAARGGRLVPRRPGGTPMTDRMTDPTTPRPTDAAIALDKAWRELEADALASDGAIRDRDVRDAIKRNRARIEAAAIATIDPRVIAIGQAWVAAEAAAEASILPEFDNRMPEGEALIEVGRYSWGDSAFYAQTYQPAAWASVRGPTPEAALEALALALTDGVES